MDQPNEPMALMSWMFLENVSMMESNTHGGGSGIPMDSDAARRQRYSTAAVGVFDSLPI